MASILLFIQFLLFSLISTRVYRKLIKESHIPDEFKEFIRDKKGLCVYMIYDTKEFEQTTFKEPQFVNKGDYSNINKIVETLQGEKHFNARWSQYLKQVDKIKKLKTCNKKFITVYESFFSEVNERDWSYVLFTPVRKIFMENKLRELKQLSDKDTVISVN